MPRTPVRTQLEKREALASGMGIAVTARESPDRPAIVSDSGTRSFDELNARANQLARALRARGLEAGDAVGLVCSNRSEFAECYCAALRSGLRLTPINWHLKGDEVAYILSNCEARAFLCDARFAAAGQDAMASLDPAESPAAMLAIGGAIGGFEGYEAALEAQSPDDIDDPAAARRCSTRRAPPGVPRAFGAGGHPRAGRAPPRWRPPWRTSPAGASTCHGAALSRCAARVLAGAAAGIGLHSGDDGRLGSGARPRFDRRARRHPHAHGADHVPPAALAAGEVRAGHDLSSLQMVLHGAAPCPVPVKQSLIEWLGPVVYEYYAATEGWGSFVDSEQWLARPGTVGRPEPGQVKILDEAGNEAPVGVPDDEWGESVLAAVETKPGVAGGQALALELIDWCRERLAHYKCPKRIEFTADLPRFETGKIYRRVLRERYRARGGVAEGEVRQADHHRARSTGARATASPARAATSPRSRPRASSSATSG